MVVDSKKIAKNTIYMYFRMIINIIIAFYTSRIILQILGVIDYGIHNAIGGIVGLFIFLNSAMTEATQRFMSFELGVNNHHKLAKTFSMCLNVHILISILIFFTGEIVGIWLLFNKMDIPEDRMQTAFWVFQFSIFASVLNVAQVPFTAALYAHENFNTYAIFQILRSVLILIFAILLSFIDGDKLLWYALFILIVQLVIVITNVIYNAKNYMECTYHFVWDKKLFRQLLSYTSWNLSGQMSNTLVDQGANLLMNMFFGPAMNAARGIAIQVQNAVSSLVWNFQGASIPQIVKLYARGERDSYVRLVNASSKISFFIFYLMVVPICLEMRMLLNIWLGQATDYMVFFSIFVLVNVLAAAFGGTLVFLIQATGKIKKFQLFSTCSNLLVFALTYILYKNGYNAYVFYLLILVSKIAIDIYTFYLIKKLIDYPIYSYYKGVVIPEFCVSIIGLVIPVLLCRYMESNYLRVFLVFSSCITINTILIWKLGLNSNEKKWTREVFMGLFSRFYSK